MLRVTAENLIKLLQKRGDLSANNTDADKLEPTKQAIEKKKQEANNLLIINVV